MKRLIISLFLELCCPLVVFPQSGTFWRTTQYPYGGTVHCLQTGASGRVFVGTDRGVFSRRPNEEWHTEDLGIDSLKVNVIAMNAGGEMYVGCADGTLLLKAFDNVKTVTVHLFAGEIRKILFSRDGDIIVLLPRSILSSFDEGKTWTDITGNLGISFPLQEEQDERGDSLEFQSMIVDKEGALIVGTNGYGIFTRGASDTFWREVADNSEFVHFAYDCEILSMCIDKDNALYIGTGGYGIYRSSTKDSSWTRILHSPPEDYVPVYALCLDSLGTIYAGTATGVLRSTDQGHTWSAPTPSLMYSKVTDLALTSTGDLLVGTGASGVFQSEDRGTTYEQIGVPTSDPMDVRTIVVDSSNIVYFSRRSDGVYNLIPTASHWNRVLDGVREWEYRALGIDTLGRILAGTYNGAIMVSPDSGKQWNILTDWSLHLRWKVQHSGLQQGFGTIESIGLTKEKVILVGDVSGIARSPDNGNTWERLYVPFQPSVLGFFFSPTGDIYATTLNEGPLISTDKGTSWGYLRARVRNPKRYPDLFWGLGFDSDNQPLAQAFAGVYRSTDKGWSWTPVLSRPGEPITALIKDKRGRLYAGAKESGVFVSLDDGISWTELNTGLSSTHITCLAQDNNGFLLAGTSDAGVFRSTESTDAFFGNFK